MYFDFIGAMKGDSLLYQQKGAKGIRDLVYDRECQGLRVM
jgi:hypothetical protein